MCVHVEISARPADKIGPKIQLQLMPVFDENFLPCLKLRTFGIENQSIEVEY